jgi:hypothetical protein
MSFSYRHQGGSLPIRLDLDESEVTQDCPTCERAGMSGVVKIIAPTSQMKGMAPASCTNGHLIMVNWEREAPADDAQ